MSSADFATLVPFPTVIDAPGRYITRCGEAVEIYSASSHHAFACYGKYPCGIVDRWHKSGRLFFGQESQNDIVRRARQVELQDQTWGYTNPINSAADYRDGFYQHSDSGSLDAPTFIPTGCTVENVTKDQYMTVRDARVRYYIGGRHVIGGIVVRGF